MSVAMSPSTTLALLSEAQTILFVNPLNAMEQLGSVQTRLLTGFDASQGVPTEVKVAYELFLSRAADLISGRFASTVTSGAASETLTNDVANARSMPALSWLSPLTFANETQVARMLNDGDINHGTLVERAAGELRDSLSRVRAKEPARARPANTSSPWTHAPVYDISQWELRFKAAAKAFTIAAAELEEQLIVSARQRCAPQMVKEAVETLKRHVLHATLVRLWLQLHSAGSSDSADEKEISPHHLPLLSIDPFMISEKALGDGDGTRTTAAKSVKVQLRTAIPTRFDERLERLLRWELAPQLGCDLNLLHGTAAETAVATSSAASSPRDMFTVLREVDELLDRISRALHSTWRAVEGRANAVAKAYETAMRTTLAAPVEGRRKALDAARTDFFSSMVQRYADLPGGEAALTVGLVVIRTQSLQAHAVRRLSVEAHQGCAEKQTSRAIKAPPNGNVDDAEIPHDRADGAALEEILRAPQDAHSAADALVQGLAQLRQRRRVLPNAFDETGPLQTVQSMIVAQKVAQQSWKDAAKGTTLIASHTYSEADKGFKGGTLQLSSLQEAVSILPSRRPGLNSMLAAAVKAGTPVSTRKVTKDRRGSRTGAADSAGGAAVKTPPAGAEQSEVELQAQVKVVEEDIAAITAKSAPPSSNVDAAEAATSGDPLPVVVSRTENLLLTPPMKGEQAACVNPPTSDPARTPLQPLQPLSPEAEEALLRDQLREQLRALSKGIPATTESDAITYEPANVSATPKNAIAIEPDDKPRPATPPHPPGPTVKPVSVVASRYPFLAPEPCPGVYLDDLDLEADPRVRAALHRLSTKKSSVGHGRGSSSHMAGLDVRVQEASVNAVVRTLAEELREATIDARRRAFPFLPVRVGGALLGSLVPHLEADELFMSLLRVHSQVVRGAAGAADGNRRRRVGVERCLCGEAERIASEVFAKSRLMDRARIDHSIVALEQVETVAAAMRADDPSAQASSGVSAPQISRGSDLKRRSGRPPVAPAGAPLHGTQNSSEPIKLATLGVGETCTSKRVETGKSMRLTKRASSSLLRPRQELTDSGGSAGSLDSSSRPPLSPQEQQRRLSNRTADTAEPSTAPAAQHLARIVIPADGSRSDVLSGHSLDAQKSPKDDTEKETALPTLRGAPRRDSLVRTHGDAPDPGLGSNDGCGGRSRSHHDRETGARPSVSGSLRPLPGTRVALSAGSPSSRISLAASSCPPLRGTSLPSADHLHAGAATETGTEPSAAKWPTGPSESTAATADRPPRSKYERLLQEQTQQTLETGNTVEPRLTYLSGSHSHSLKSTPHSSPAMRDDLGSASAPPAVAVGARVMPAFAQTMPVRPVLSAVRTLAPAPDGVASDGGAALTMSGGGANSSTAHRRTSGYAVAVATGSRMSRSLRARPPLETPPEASLHETYLAACEALSVRPNSALIRSFPATPNTFVDKVDLSINYVGVKGLVPVLYVLEANGDRLRFLSLCNNNLENMEVLELLEVLAGKAGDGLAHLDLSYNPISQTGGQALLRFCASRPNLTTVKLKGTLIPPKLMQTIVDKAEDNSFRKHIGVP